MNAALYEEDSRTPKYVTIATWVAAVAVAYLPVMSMIAGN